MEKEADPVKGYNLHSDYVATETGDEQNDRLPMKTSINEEEQLKNALGQEESKSQDITFKSETKEAIEEQKED